MTENTELKNKISDDMMKAQNRLQNQINENMNLKAKLNDEEIKNKALTTELNDLQSNSYSLDNLKRQLTEVC